MNAYQPNIRASLPDNIEAEQALLGAIFVNNDAYWRVAAFIKKEHFSEPIHGFIYDTMGTMISAGRAVNPVTIKSYMPADQMVGDLTIMQYLARLMAEAVTVINAYEYGRGIIESWSRRRLISLAQDLDELARNMPVDMTPEKIISSTADVLTMIAQEGNERAGSLKYGVLLPQAIDRVAKASLSTTSLIPWYLPEITMVAGDIRRGNHIGVMSDSGGGKTSFAIQQCRHAAIAGFRSAFFTIEITDEEAALQAAAQASRISMGRIDAYTMDTRELERIEAEVMKSTDLPFDIVGFSDCSLSDIRIKMEAMKKSVGLDLVIIDHAKMIALPNPKDIFAERINALYRGLKAIAKSLDVAVVTLIQRNDEWKARWRASGSIRPMMGDAYGGGSVKQNLDVWFSLYRPEPLYKELIPLCPPERAREGVETKRDKMIKDYENSRGKAWIINHKRRRGEPGNSQQINFEAEYTSFTSSQSNVASADVFEDFFQ